MLNTTNFEDVLNDTTVLTSPDIELTEADIIYTAEILYNYWQFEGADPGVSIMNIYWPSEHSLNSEFPFTYMRLSLCHEINYTDS